MIKKNRNKGTINVLQGGGGQRSMVKDHTFTTKKFGPFPKETCSYGNVVPVTICDVLLF